LNVNPPNPDPLPFAELIDRSAKICGRLIGPVAVTVAAVVSIATSNQRNKRESWVLDKVTDRQPGFRSRFVLRLPMPGMGPAL